MPRSNRTQSTYRLTSPPNRNRGLPIAFVARGRRIRAVDRHFMEELSPGSPTPTEPLSSPLRPGRALHRTYAVMRPPDLNIKSVPYASAAPAGGTHTNPSDAHLDIVNTPSQTRLEGNDSSPLTPILGVEIGKDAHLDIANTPSQTRLEGNDSSPLTPILGVEIGKGLFYPINPTKLPIPTFDTPMAIDDFIQTRVKLDSSNGGLTPTQFCGMMGRCRGCERYMMNRSKDHHRCQGKCALPTPIPVGKNPLLLLDSTSGGQGLTKSQFRQLFASCPICKLVFTRSAAAHHTHNDDDDRNV